jgi:signal peptidase
VALLAVTAFLALTIAPRVLGFQTLTMLTGSMAPLINPGDVVVTKPVPIEDIRVGGIFTYSISVEDHRIETHRVTEVITNADGTTAVRIKGDANNGSTSGPRPPPAPKSICTLPPSHASGVGSGRRGPAFGS